MHDHVLFAISCSLFDNCSMKFTIVGLGNPGAEYVGTPHNIGREIVETFVTSYIKKPEWKTDKKANAQTIKIEVGNATAMCVLPDTFMNNSGKAVANMVVGAKNIERTVIVHDDLDLPLGTMKLSFNRGSGGHNGVKSISRALKTDMYFRLRVGVAPTTPSGKIKKPQGEQAVIDYILKPLRNKDAEVKKITKRAVEALGIIVSEPHEKALTLVNSL